MKKTILISVMIMALLVLAGCSAKKDKVAATVNGEAITWEELDLRVNEIKSGLEEQGFDFSGEKGQVFMESLRRDTLDQMINTTLMLQEARKLGSLTNEQIQENVRDFRDQFPSEEEYREFLKRARVSEEEAGYILYLQDEVTREVPPALEADVRKYYEENRSQFSYPEQMQVRHILFFVDEGDKGYPVQRKDAEAKSLAGGVIGQLAQGVDFAELAREKSEDSGTRDKGGLFVFSQGEAVEEFYQAANSLKPGEHTKTPVKTEFGYHVILLEKRIPARQETFDQVREKLSEQIHQQACQEKFNTYMQEAWDRAEIVDKLAGR